jgi:hypothetical protein
MLAKRRCRVLVALAFALVTPAMAQAGPPACGGGRIQAAGECVDKERVASEIDKIVRRS